jgi:outer membrane protein TolC
MRVMDRHGVLGALLSGACAVASAHALAQAPLPATPGPPSQSTAVEPFRSNERPLTLGECVRRALSRGFDLELQQHDLAIAREDVPIAESLFRPVFSADGTKNRDRTARDSDLLAGLRSSGVASHIGVDQRLRSGTLVTLGSSLNRFESNQPVTTISGNTLTTLPSNLTYTNGLTLGVTQPLLKGFGGVNTIPIRQAEIGIDIAEQSYEERALDVIEQTEAAYYLLTGARDQLSVLRTSQRLAERLLDEARARHDAGMGTKLDLLEAQVGIANARLNVLQAENAVRAGEDQLHQLIGRFEFDAPIGPTVVEEGAPNPLPTVEASYTQALDHLPALRSARSVLELSKLQLALAKDDLKPAVDLGVTLGLTGDDRSNNNAWSNAFEPERSAWQAGLNVTYPLGRVGEKARFRQASRALMRDELSVQRLEQNTLAAIRDAIRRVETSRESIRIATLAANYAQVQYEAERMRYQSGLSTSRRVLEAQEDLESARVVEVQSKLNLRTSLSTLYRLEGSSPARYGITLRADGQ